MAGEKSGSRTPDQPGIRPKSACRLRQSPIRTPITDMFGFPILPLSPSNQQTGTMDIKNDHRYAINLNVRGIQPSATLRINELSNQLRSEGKDIIKLGLG